jgi:hypothetical protein
VQKRGDGPWHFACTNSARRLMDSNKPGRIDRHKSDFDVMEHVIGGFYAPNRGMDEPRGHANDHPPPRRSGGQKPSHPKPKLRHK